MQGILTTFKAYCGSGFYPLLFLAALIYLLVTEKDRKIRIVLLNSSLVITVLFFLPFFKEIMDILDEGTYYRILWLLPMSVVIAYAGVKLIGRHTKIGCIALVLVLILTGQNVYRNVNVSKAQNRYHIPNSVIAICNEIMPEPDKERAWAVFPDELIHFVRQYTSEVQMPYGREMLVPEWGWNWDTHPIYEVMREDTVDIDALAPLLVEYEVQYLILNRAKPTSGDFEENGLTKMTEIESYDLYRVEAVEIY